MPRFDLLSMQRATGFQWDSNPFHLSIMQTNSTKDEEMNRVLINLKKTLYIAPRPKKRDTKHQQKRKRQSSKCKSNSSTLKKGKGNMLKEIKEKIDDTIEEVKCLLKDQSISFDLIFKQQFKAPQLQDEWVDWKLLNTGAPKEQNNLQEGSELEAHNRTIEIPTMISQSIIQRLFKQLNEIPITSLKFGPPTSILGKDFFCHLCPWEKINISEFDTAKSKDIHYQKIHKQYLCEKCGRSEINTHNIANHKKMNLCIYQNKFQHEKYISQTSQIINDLAEIVRQEENNCAKCKLLKEYKNPSVLKIGQHLLTVHGEFRVSQVLFSQLDHQAVLSQLHEKDLSLLCSKNFIRINDEGAFEKQCDEKLGQNSLMLMLYNGKLRVAISFCIENDLFSRIAFVYNYWVSGEYSLDFAIAMAELQLRVEHKRVGKICIYSDKGNAWYLQKLNFKPHARLSCFEDLAKNYCNIENSGLYYIQTKEYIKSYIPLAKTPQPQFTTKKSDLLRIIIMQLKFNGLVELLKEYLEIQLASTGKKHNLKAIKTDQAITPKGIFKEIYERVRIHPYQMFDVCKYQQNWDASIHYNALVEDWPGEFIFVNPPFSVGSWFVTKIFLEFLRGKNIIVILPEISTECSFGSILFRMLGSVHQLGIIKFDAHERKLRSPVSQIFLIQPDHIDYLKNIRKIYKNNGKPSAILEQKKMQFGKMLNLEKKKYACRLLEQKLSVREIQQLTGMSFSTIRKVRQEMGGFIGASESGSINNDPDIGEV